MTQLPTAEGRRTVRRRCCELLPETRVGVVEREGVAMEQKLGTVIISPAVLSMIARLTTLSVPGVARMASSPVRRVLGSRGCDGVKLEVVEDTVVLDVFVVAASDINMLQLSREIQGKVTRAIHEIVGMPVREVNVHIVDVADTTSTQA
jgi:uncharacterized alkaline shock family protein YloU